MARASGRGELRSLGGGGRRRGPPPGARNEVLALRALAAACEEALHAFPTSLEHDDALLTEGRLGPRARFAVVQRRGEKRVLRRWIDLAGAALPILRLPWGSLVAAVGRHSGDGDLDRYLRSVVSALAARRCGARPVTQEEASA